MLLAGIRVLEWAEGLAAPYATRLLADLGAEVIKVEPPGGGDMLRREGPAIATGDAALFGTINHGKRSLTLDPTRPSGAALFRALARGSQVLVEAQPPGLLQQSGLGVRELQAATPGLVVVSVSRYGQTGALRDRAGTDLTVLHHAGFAWHAARPVGDPEQQGPVGGADREMPLAFGVATAVATLWGVLQAQATGRGPHIDMAEFDFFAQLLIEALADYCDSERTFDRRRREFRGTEVAGGLIWILRCADGWVMVSPREQHQWDRWMALQGNPAWASDPALCGDRLARKQNWAVLQELMSEWTARHPKQQVFERAQAARVACFPVSTPADILGNAQLAHRRFFDRLHLASGTTLAVPGLPFALRDGAGEELPRGRDVAAPPLGEANDAILQQELSLRPDEIDALRRHGIV